MVFRIEGARAFFRVPCLYTTVRNKIDRAMAQSGRDMYVPPLASLRQQRPINKHNRTDSGGLVAPGGWVVCTVWDARDEKRHEMSAIASHSIFPASWPLCRSPTRRPDHSTGRRICSIGTDLSMPGLKTDDCNDEVGARCAQHRSRLAQALHPLDVEAGVLGLGARTAGMQLGMTSPQSGSGC